MPLVCVMKKLLEADSYCRISVEGHKRSDGLAWFLFSCG